MYTLTIEERAMDSEKEIVGYHGVHASRSIFINDEQLRLLNTGLYSILPQISAATPILLNNGQSALRLPNLVNVQNVVNMIFFFENLLKNINSNQSDTIEVTPNVEK